ncbi:MAG: SDR family oxidoreductase [Pseudomonadales bacterium]
MLLQKKIVIVSGIGPGLGQKLSTLVAKEGALVILAARTPEKLDVAESEIRELGLGTETLKVPTDISDRAQCKNLVDKTIERFGRVDVLINSAYSGGKIEPIETADLEDWRNTVNINLIGTMQLTQEVIPHMKKQKGGAIVMVNTMAVHKPMLYNGGYASSKAALKSAAAHLALEVGQFGIRVNSTFMGWMWGPNVASYVQQAAHDRALSEEDIKDEIAQNIPLRHIPEDGDCAKAVVMLASDYASEVTGACLDVNGGDYIP